MMHCFFTASMPVYYRNGRLAPGVFREIGDGMSTDWNKYSTPIDSVCRAKTPKDNGIVSLKVKGIRRINLAVNHSPGPKNMAHTLVKGRERKIDADPEARLKLLNMAVWELKVGEHPLC